MSDRYDPFGTKIRLRLENVVETEEALYQGRAFDLKFLAYCIEGNASLSKHLRSGQIVSLFQEFKVRANSGL